jgi:hypothetical protein
LKAEEDLVREPNQDNKLKEMSMLYDYSRLDCMLKPEWGALKLQSFLNGNGQRQAKAGSDRYDGLENLLWWRILFEVDCRPGGLISWVFKLWFQHRLKVMIEKSR